jgi:hypothetical protein
MRFHPAPRLRWQDGVDPRLSEAAADVWAEYAPGWHDDPGDRADAAAAFELPFEGEVMRPLIGIGTGLSEGVDFEDRAVGGDGHGEHATLG